MSRPVVFLDRDGVLCVEKSYIRTVKELEIFSYAKTCIESIHKKGYLVIVVSNQSGIARGYFSEKNLLQMNKRLYSEVGVDDIIYCPHYVNGIVKEYAIKCECRKPGIGMIRKAQEKYDIDMNHSYMIGDRASDIQMGINAGLKTILVNSGYGVQRLEADVIPDFICDDLMEAVSYV